MSLLHISQLSVDFAPRRRGQEPTHAVQAVDLHMEAGQRLGLVGESGSGKSTIARALLGLNPRGATVTGTIAVAGSRVDTLDKRARRELLGTTLGYVPQDPGSSLNPLMRIGTQVGEVLEVHQIGGKAERGRAVEQALQDAGLDPAVSSRFPHQLSGGQRQRVLIAMAIIAKPALIIADEPTSALDATVQKHVLDTLDRLVAATGAGLLLITHDLGVAAERTDQLITLRHGEIVESGRTVQVLGNPSRDYTRTLVAAMPRADAPPRRRLPAPVQTAPALLAASGLHRSFGRGEQAVTALDDVTLSIPEGGAVGVVGESGSGKTTLARVLLGLDRPDSGTVELSGVRQTKQVGGREFRRRVQPVFQNPYTSFDPSRRVGYSVLEPVRSLKTAPRAQHRELLEKLFTQVGLDPALVERRPEELSGGQLQRLAIARALSADPQLLVCDEAVSALDVTVQAQILDLLAGLREERKLSLLFITHDLCVLRELCEYSVVMHRGRIIEQGPTGRLLDDPGQTYTRSLIEALPAMPDFSAAQLLQPAL
ncbi:peptide ABC transporter ATP-binding protein [Glutamicibacter uratoxydans]|uniref:Peptide ABC transporter ATP-binding protein n=1 Tax=Glutamicibacter uratoxydans TaxID=43667 RepID=A0A4Y4DV59_GLUUR|nr:ABC transporter ATP-binding protein [Glutamicibacter uratoxydans]GED07744.1 peptide ABC transporter ATP-binding protein [Glutamicibacter uratoxydans]